MHLIEPRVLGGLIALLLAALVGVKRVSTGSILDRLTGGWLVQAVNAFNLFFLLVVNPLAAAALLTRRLEALDPTHVALESGWLRTAIESAGLAVYLLGFVLMAWALLALGRNYQLGGVTPRASDRLVARGPYRLIRHPMYAAAIAIAFGLSSLVQSGAVACVFGLYLLLILPLIPREEEGLRRAYGSQFDAYRAATARLVPFVY